MGLFVSQIKKPPESDDGSGTSYASGSNFAEKCRRNGACSTMR